MKKRIMALTLAIVMVFGLCGITASAAVQTRYVNRNHKHQNNCVLWVREYRVDSLPYGLNTLNDKIKIINSKTPTVGAVAIMKNGNSYGHVAYVSAINGNKITIEESNNRGRFAIRTGTAKEFKDAKSEIVGYFVPKGKPPKGNYFPQYKGKSNSLVEGLKAVGANSSYSYREKIAKANGISGYRGTSAQNTKMLNLLKKGTLKKP